MVKFNTRPSFWYHEDLEFNDDDYWKLSVVPDTSSPTRGCIQRGDLDSAALRHFQRHSRQQRGMLIYDYCSDDDLRRFCQQRGLQLLDSCRTREGMIHELERADDYDTCFSTFLDLLPELRLRVYQFYRESLGDSFRPYFAAPPIMSVSKIVREEAASVLYREHMFMCSLNRDVFEVFPPRRRLYIDDATRLFFENAPLVFIKNVRRLQVWSSLPEPKLGMNHGGGLSSG